MAMNKGLQTHVIRELLEKNGINPDLVDVEAEIDSNLTLEENIKQLSKKLGIRLTNSMKKELESIALDDDYEEQKNNELLEEYLNMNGITEDFEETEEKDEETEIEEVMRELEAHREQLNLIFSEMVKKRDVVSLLSRYLFPEIVGEQYEPVRRATLLTLATHHDIRKRTRIHILLHGDAGSGKTEILLWLKNKLNAYFVNAEYASKVGLAGDARGNEITPGALAEANGMVMCIDELDKMSYKDQSALLQAMEEGQYTIIKGKHRKKFNAEVRVIATANDITKIQKPLLDRFDFVFHLKTPNKEERAEQVEKLIDQFFGFFESPEGDVVREYMSWIRSYEPGVEELDTIKSVMRSYIKLTNQTDKSYRSLELSILRVGYALAKLQHSNITPKTIVRAIQMKDDTLTAEQIRYLNAVASNLI